MADEVNAMRAEIGLGPVSTKLPHSCPFKDGKRPNYEPPAKVLATMTKEQLSLWRKEERKKRKAIKQRDNRRRKAAMIKGLKDELALSSSTRIEEKDANKSESNPVTKAAVIEELQVKEPANSLVNAIDETLIADPYVENNTDTAPWIGLEEVVSSHELVQVFDVPAKVVSTAGSQEIIQDTTEGIVGEDVSLLSNMNFELEE